MKSCLWLFLSMMKHPINFKLKLCSKHAFHGSMSVRDAKALPNFLLFIQRTHPVQPLPFIPLRKTSRPINVRQPSTTKPKHHASEAPASFLTKHCSAHLPTAPNKARTHARSRSRATIGFPSPSLPFIQAIPFHSPPLPSPCPGRISNQLI